MSYAIETSGVCYRAGWRFEIRDLGLHVPQGAVYGFLGPNGSGKTTSIRLLMGLLRARSGRIRVLGREIPAQTPDMLRSTGFVPERPHLHLSFTVEEALRFHSAFYPSWDWKWAEELLSRFRLERAQGLLRLSKGEMGKLLILLALAQQPDLLLLDEPTDGLDPVVRREVLTALLDYVARRTATVLISSHLVHELERICDWVGVLDAGRLVAEMPMISFKAGIKRLRVARPPERVEDTPFILLDRTVAEGAHETWIVRGWQPPMSQYFDSVGATLREVIDLDLEEGFVELLRSARPHAS